MTLGTGSIEAGQIVIATSTGLQALVALTLGLISSGVALAVRFEGSGRIFANRRTCSIAVTIIAVSTIGTASTVVLLPLIGKLHPAAFVPLALVMPSGLAFSGKGSKRRADGEESPALSNITKVITLGISYLLRRLEETIAGDGHEWAATQVKKWREDGILGAADHYHELLRSRFAANAARCKEIDAIRDRIEENIRAAELTTEQRKKLRSLGEARIELMLLLQRAYAWGCSNITAYAGLQRSTISDGELEYDISVSFPVKPAADADVKPEEQTAKQLVALALDLTRVGQEGSDAAIGERLTLLHDSLPSLIKEISERQSPVAGEGSQEPDTGRTREADEET